MDTPDDGGALMGTRIGQRALDEVPGPTGDAPLRRLRAICLALPEATEKLSHGEPTWFVRKVFVTFAGRHHDDRVATGRTSPGNLRRHVRLHDRPRPRPPV